MIQPTGKDEDYGDYYKAKPTSPVLESEISVQVVGRRCVYVNDYRIAGGKPYYSENLPNHNFKTTIRQALDAFPDKILKEALKERKERAAYFNKWQLARAALKENHDGL